MSKSNKFDVAYIASLAKLKLKKKDVAKFESQLTSVVNYFNQIGEIDTTDIDPVSQTTELTNVLRKDEVKAKDQLSLNEDALLSKK
jgi:aspartyl-tRNA(Asn)/glutamyl-tRNA(Gln) amidotransferase subunit C